MNEKEYRALADEYVTVDEETVRRCLLQFAFLEFDSRVEVYCENGYEEWNDGRSILDISVDDVHEIILDFIKRDGEEGNWCRDDMMNNAIMDVTGLRC